MLAERVVQLGGLEGFRGEQIQGAFGQQVGGTQRLGASILQADFDGPPIVDNIESVLVYMISPLVESPPKEKGRPTPELIRPRRDSQPVGPVTDTQSLAVVMDRYGEVLYGERVSLLDANTTRRMSRQWTGGIWLTRSKEPLGMPVEQLAKHGLDSH
jgi:hypothetical protein